MVKRNSRVYSIYLASTKIYIAIYFKETKNGKRNESIQSINSYIRIYTVPQFTFETKNDKEIAESIQINPFSYQNQYLNLLLTNKK